MLSCFAGTGDAEGGLLMLSLRRQQGSGRTEGHGGGKVAEPLAVQPENGVSDGMEALRQMFPDCGDVFLGACLRAFDMSPERTIDALLSVSLCSIVQHVLTVLISLGKPSARNRPHGPEDQGGLGGESSH